jgi:hypothetical protein
MVVIESQARTLNPIFASKSETNTKSEAENDQNDYLLPRFEHSPFTGI